MGVYKKRRHGDTESEATRIKNNRLSQAGHTHTGRGRDRPKTKRTECGGKGLGGRAEEVMERWGKKREMMVRAEVGGW